MDKGVAGTATPSLAAAICCSTRVTSCSPASGTPSAAAMLRMWSLTPSSVCCAGSITTGMPASRNCWSTSGGPMLSSARMTLGFRPRIVSADRSMPAVVTSGKSLAASNVVEISRPTTFPPNPRLNTISAIEP